MSKRLVIMRGLPGSGKSTYVRLHYTDSESVVCSADDFFVQPDGEYLFNPTLLPRAHGECMVRAEVAMRHGMPLVIVDNTNTTSGEWLVYQHLAGVHGYEVELVTVFDGGLTDAELAARNRHGVPEVAIAAMRARWEGPVRTDRKATVRSIDTVATGSTSTRYSFTSEMRCPLAGKRRQIRYHYTVRQDSGLPFPEDMLRYDHAEVQSTPREEVRRIVGHHPPTEGRWKSFGWSVMGQVERVQVEP